MSEHAISRTGNVPPTRGFGQLWQVPTFLLGVICLALVAANSKLRHDPAAAQFQGELAQLRQALDDKSGKIQPWLDKSGDVLAGTERFPAQAAEAYFLVGSLFWRASEEAPVGQETAQRSKAEEYLEKALSLRLADKDLPNLKHRLGVVLYRQGRDFGRAVELMKDGLGRGADAGGRGYEILLEAVAKQSNPNLQEAVDIAKRWLERTGDNAETQNRARITLAELLIRAGNRRDATRYLEAVSKSASKGLRLKSQYLLAGCFEAGKQWRSARKIWEELLKTPEAVSGGKGQVLFSLGVCSCGDDDTAAALKWWKQALPLGGEEAQAALLHIGETESAAGEADTALPSWTEALAQVHRPADYRNAYVSLEQVREMFETTAAVLIDKRNFDSVRKLAELYERVAVPGKAELYRGQAFEALARKAVGGEAAALFEKAGLAFEQVALALSGEERTEPFRRSADCYRLASKHPQSARVLAELVKLEKGPLPLAEAWLDLAEAYYAQKQTDKARLAWRRCLEIPGAPSGDRARYLLAFEEKNAGNPERALEYLKQIPVHSLNRAAFEDAQFLHGSLLMDMKKYVEAELKLDAAIKEAPSHPSAYQARAELADCYRKQADKLKEIWMESSGKETVGEVTNKKRWRDKLELAMLTYQALADDLQNKASLNSALSPDLLRLLRLASFTTAELLFELGDVAEAVRHYQKLQQDRYPREVEGLIACDRIFYCLPYARPQEKQKMQQIVLESLNIAQEHLARMDAKLSGFVNPPGVRSRLEWQTWINERREELARLQGADPAPRK